MQVDVLLGLQWGDEGKGKIVDYLAKDYQIVARFQGGPNAGHTLYYEGQKIVLHTIPSGVFHPHLQNLIGNGVVIDPVVFVKEMAKLDAAGVDIREKLFISRKAHLILPTHKILDQASEKAKGKNKIGSTLKGIGPAYMDKTGRNGLRVGDIELKDFILQYEKLKQKHFDLLQIYNFDFDISEMEDEWMKGIDLLRSMNLVDCEYMVNEALERGEKVLAEGAQGSMLDIEFGTYPFVTSSNTLASGACQGLGVAPNKIGEVFGISKAYCTRVGGGPFPTELFGETGEFLRKKGHEFGATTGRPRRCGWIDLPALKYAIQLNGVTQLTITKADVMDEMETFEVCTGYEIDGKITKQVPFDLERIDVKPVLKRMEGWKKSQGFNSMNELPENLKNYLVFLEENLGVPVTILSVGPNRDDLVVK